MSIIGFGAGPIPSARGAITPGRIQGGSPGLGYPSPFFDVAHTYMPVTVKQLFRWCRYYFLTNPLINAAAFKLSEYPITDVIVDHPNEGTRKRWEEYLHDHLDIQTFRVEANLDYHVYGNGMGMPGFPFKKFLVCQRCRFQDEASKIRSHWTFTNFVFRLHCPKCQHIGDAEPKDLYLKNPNGIRLLRWNPEDLEITYNDITGEYTHYYTIPAPIRSDVVMGRKEIVEALPQVFLQALREQKGVIFNKEIFFHMRRPTVANQDRGWGTPLLLPVLKDTYYLQLMKKAQECVSPETLIETVGGLVPAAEVSVGDLVRTHTGRFARVSKKAVRPMVEERGDYAVKVTLTGMRQMPSIFSDNHPLWVLRRNDVNRRIDTKEHRRSSYVLRNPSLYGFEWVDAGNVQVGDYVGYPTARNREVNEVDLASYTAFSATDSYVYSGVSVETANAFEAAEEGRREGSASARKVALRHLRAETAPKRAPRRLPLNEDLAFIAGWYLGDGSTGDRHVAFAMGPDDDGVELQAAIERVFGATCSATPCAQSRGWMLVCSETIFAEFMAGWIPGHAKTKKIPKEILSAPDAVVLAFLRGYLAADGHSRKKEDDIAVCCSNRFLCYQLWSLLLSLRCISTISERTSYDTIITKKDGTEQFLEGGRAVFYWAVSARSALRLKQLMRGEEAVVVDSGKSGFFVHDYFAYRVSATEVVPCSEVISFEVEDDHTFCVPGMATHNSILLEHIVPLRIIFPQAGTGSSDPYSTINLVGWREQIAREIARWRYDNNYVPILSLPVGTQTIGGDGRALLLTAEMQAHGEQILNGMTVPIEFVKGGMSFAGTNVSMRMLENQFLRLISQQRKLVQFMVNRIGAYLDWPIPTIRFKPFKMADDIQRRALDLQLNQVGVLSETSLLSGSDYNFEDEVRLSIEEASLRHAAMKKKMVGMAEIQGESSLVSAKWQAKAQQVMTQAAAAPAAPGEAGSGVAAPTQGDPLQVPPDAAQFLQSMGSQLSGRDKMLEGGKQQLNVDMPSFAMAQAQQISTLPANMQPVALQNIEAQSPELAQLVKQYLAELQAKKQQSNGLMDTRPLPEQRSPRRAVPSV